MITGRRSELLGLMWLLGHKWLGGGAGGGGGRRTKAAAVAASTAAPAMISHRCRNAVTAPAAVAGTPMMVTSTATPSAAATWRAMFTRAEPVPNRAAGSAVGLP